MIVLDLFDPDDSPKIFSSTRFGRFTNKQ